MSVVKVLDGSYAQYHRSTGLMRIGGVAEKILSVLNLDSREDEEHELVEVFWHEWVHHLQALSCAHIQLEGLERLQTSANLVLSGDKKVQINSAKRLAWINRRFVHRAFGVSICDLCEGAAVLESFRICHVDPTVEEFLHWRNKTFPGKGNDPYRRTFDILTNETSAEVAFDLLPVLTFLALQGDVPGAAFETLLVKTRTCSKELVGAPVEEIIMSLGYEVLLERFLRINELHISQRHAILYPVLVSLVNNLDFEELIEIFVRPHTIKNQSKKQHGINEFLLPPMLVGAHRLGAGMGLVFGVAREDRILREKILLSTSLVLAAEAMLSSGKKHVPCPNHHCPNHSGSSCNGYFTPPEDPDMCRFRNEIKNMTGHEVHEIFDLVRSLPITNELEHINSCKETSEIFPEIEFKKNAELTSCAERFDERYMLDPEDNDPVYLIFCTTPGCNTSLQIRASARQGRRGFVVGCSNCGKEYQVNSRTIPKFHFNR